jgi:Protein of unknown function (DUF1302)
MRWHSKLLLVGGSVVAAALLGTAPQALASQSFANQQGEIAARVSTQNTFQHNSAQSINWVQWRNEIRFDLRYDLIRQGSGVTWGPIKTLKFNMLYRARMDPVYMLRDSYKNRDYDRGNFEFPEGKAPRELFFDMGFDGPLKNLSVRVGKQQVVWGESDLFRSIDVVNPLDLTQSGFVGEDFSDFRRPLWIAKFLYNIGDVASFWNEAGIEAFWSPNSQPEVNQHNILIGETYKIGVGQSVPNVGQGGAFTRNMSNPFNMVRHPWEFLRVGALNGDSPANVQTGGLSENGAGQLADFMYRIKNDVPPSELSLDAMMAGVRLLGTTWGNAYFTINYLFKRSDGASASAPPIQLNETNPALCPGGDCFGSGTTSTDAVLRGINAAYTPDLNGNGIPDGSEQQILNCLQSRIPTSTGFSNGSNPVGVAPMTTPGVGEVIFDPRLAGIIAGAPLPNTPGPWHGSVYSDPQHPELDTGVSSVNGVPINNSALIPGHGQLNANHVPYDPVLPLGSLSAVDGLAHASFCQDIPVFHPWTHIIGMTATYNDYEYTGLVFRMEQSYSTKEPAQQSAVSPERLLMQRDNCPLNATGFPECRGAAQGQDVFNGAANSNDFRTRNKRYYGVWRSMIGFDYLRALAPDYARKLNNDLLRSLLSDQWFFIFQFLDTYQTSANQIDHSGSFTDRYQQWNPFFTLAATGFFLHQQLRPTFAAFVDATQMYPGFFGQVGYFITPKLEMRIGEILYAGSSRSQDAGGLSYYSDRDTFYIRLTYFLA